MSLCRCGHHYFGVVIITLCGQYPRNVPARAAVSLRCSDTALPPARYVIVQFPMTDHVSWTSALTVLLI